MLFIIGLCGRDKYIFFIWYFFTMTIIIFITGGTIDNLEYATEEKKTKIP